MFQPKWWRRIICTTAIFSQLYYLLLQCAGEYVATKSQNEVIHSELELEKIHVERYLDEELSELDDLMELIGIPKDEDLGQQMRNFYEKNPKSLLQLMTALEFGVLDSEQRSPIRAGLFSCLLFAAGSIPSVVPFIFSGDDPNVGLVAATILTVTVLMLVGAVKTYVTRTNWVSSAIENLMIAGLGGVLAYTVGGYFGSLVNE
jgi:VIT1/CCC1 family predicted Fe2+/Mn2+ transporter